VSAAPLPPEIVQIVVLGLTVAAAWVDLRTRTIPNGLVLTGLVVAFVLAFVLSGWRGGLFALAGALAGFFVFLPFYLLRGMGAGDVKLFAMVGAFLGPVHGLLAALAVALVGGVLALFQALRYGRLGEVLFNFYLLFRHGIPLGTLEKSQRRGRIPYAVAIFLGVLSYLIFMAYGK
jgi:prepilin peptidase CpaA